MENFKGEVIYAVGGGLAVDAVKYIAIKQGLEIVCLPLHFQLMRLQRGLQLFV